MKMKKFNVILAVGAVLLLAGCASRMSGESTTVCEAAPSTLTTSSGVETVVTVEGYDEGIITWTERTTFEREAYERYFWRTTGVPDEDINAWFNGPQNNTPRGITWNLISVDENTVVTEFIYDYTQLTEATLREIWPGVEDFEREVTLTMALAGLESRGASCD